MTYNSTYDADDMSAIAIDGFGTAGAVVVSLVGVVILILLIIWARSTAKKV